MSEAKTANYSFRLSPSMKKEIMQRSLELKMQPADYITFLIDKDLLSKKQELPEREKTFIETQFDSFTEKLLTFFVENIDKKLATIEKKIEPSKSGNNELEKYIEKVLLFIKENGLSVDEEMRGKVYKTLIRCLEDGTKQIEQKLITAKSKQ